MRRSAMLYFLSLWAVTGLHIGLCHAAATARGHPPLLPNEIVTCFVAPFAIALPTIFDDRASTRFRGILCFSLLGAVVYSELYLNNVMYARPHPGASLGMVGLILNDWPIILIHAVPAFVILFAFCYCFDRLLEPVWNRFRTLVPATIGQNYNGSL